MASSDKLAEIKQRYRDDPTMYWVSEVDWLLGEVERLRATQQAILAARESVQLEVRQSETEIERLLPDAYMEDVKRRVRRNQAFQQRSMECHCDPPGSGEEGCTGHCVLRAEIERLTIDNRRLTEMWDADRETLTVEIERLRIELHRVAESRRGQRERAECAEAENGRLRKELELRPLAKTFRPHNQPYLTGTWPKPRVIQPCLICGNTSPGHVLVYGIGQEYVAQVCSTHALWEVLAAQTDERELFDLRISINDLDLAEKMTRETRQ